MLRCLVLVMLLAGCEGWKAVAQPPGWLVKDYKYFIETFEGRWDNDRHNFFANDAGVDTSTLSPRQHLILQKLEPSDATPTNEVRFNATRILKDGENTTLQHVISIDEDRKVIRQDILVPSETGQGACEVLWARNGGGFVGKADGAACETLFPRPYGEGDLQISMVLSEQDFWISARRGDGLTEARMRRARPFSCWVAVLRGEQHGTTGAGNDDWTFERGILLHDQYGEAIIETDETPARQISLRIRNVDWPYGTNRPSMTLYVHEAGNDRAISYAWTAYDADRIGINLRWLQASCTHSPDDMFSDF